MMVHTSEIMVHISEIMVHQWDNGSHQWDNGTHQWDNGSHQWDNHYLTDVVLTITFLIVVFNLFVRKIRLILNVEVKIGSICSVKTGFLGY
jgi:hypothetical protein